MVAVVGMRQHLC